MHTRTHGHVLQPADGRDREGRHTRPVEAGAENGDDHVARLLSEMNATTLEPPMAAMDHSSLYFTVRLNKITRDNFGIFEFGGPYTPFNAFVKRSRSLG
jgi:hypothetical protein